MLEKLDNNEAILLLYLADELPDEDRAEMDRMLAADEPMRRQLVSLQAAYEATELALAALESAATQEPARLKPGSASESAAIRRIGLAMRSHQARQLAERPAAAVSKSSLRFPWWAYPSSAVAASILAVLVWWVHHSDNERMYLPADPPMVAETLPPAPPEVIAKLRDAFPSVSVVVAQSPDQIEQRNNEQAQIEERAQELVALSDSTENAATVWNIGSGDGNE